MFGALLGSVIDSFGKLASAIWGISQERKRLKKAKRNLEVFERDHPKKKQSTEWIYKDDS